jgi:restriction system protein
METSSPGTPDVAQAIEAFIDGVLIALPSFWPVFVLVGLIVLARVGYQLYRLRRLSRSGIAEVDQMDGATFERFLGTLFRELGYGVELTPHRGDYGADLVLTKDGRRTAVQAKRWSKRVGVKAIQEAVASKGYYRCDAALVVANREFTDQARELARANDVELWGRETLVSKLLEAQREPTRNGATAAGANEATDRLPAAGTPGAAVTAALEEQAATRDTDPSEVAVCATCGRSLSEKVRDYCLARPQRFGGHVYCFMHQRSDRR